MSCKAKIKNRWSGKNWGWQTHLSFPVHSYCCYCPITANSFFCQQGNKLQGTHGYRLSPALSQSGVIFQH